MKKTILSVAILAISFGGNSLYAQKSTNTDKQNTPTFQINTVGGAIGNLLHCKNGVETLNMDATKKQQVLTNVENAMSILQAYQKELQNSKSTNAKKETPAKATPAKVTPKKQ